MSYRRHVIISANNACMLAPIKATALLLLFVVTTTCASFTPYVETLANLTSGGYVTQALYDSQGRIVYFDYGSSTVRRMELNGTITDLNTTTGDCYYMAEGPSQELYLPLPDLHAIQKIDTANALTNFVGYGCSGHDDGVGLSATFTSPMGIIYFAPHDSLYVSEDGAIRKIVITTLFVTTVLLDESYLSPGSHLTITRNGTYIYAGMLFVTRIDVATGALDMLIDANGGNTTGSATTASIGSVSAYALSLNETRLIVGDSFSMVRALNLCSGYIDNVYKTTHPFYGFQQYCFNTTTGDCGVTYSGVTTLEFQFFAFEENTTSTWASCPVSTASLTTSDAWGALAAVVAVVSVIVVGGVAAAVITARRKAKAAAGANEGVSVNAPTAA